MKRRKKEEKHENKCASLTCIYIFLIFITEHYVCLYMLLKTIKNRVLLTTCISYPIILFLHIISVHPVDVLLLSCVVHFKHLYACLYGKINGNSTEFNIMKRTCKVNLLFCQIKKKNLKSWLFSESRLH